MVEVFRDVRRVLRDDGSLWLNLGSSYATGTDADRNPTTTGGADVPASWAGRSQPIRRHPSGFKPKDMVPIPWMVAMALQQDGWYLRSDIIWCLSGGTKLYARTQKGDMPASLKDLARLDPATVKLWNGERWTQVLGWHRAGSRDDPVEIELASGERIGCTPGHVWPTQRGNIPAHDLRVGDVFQTTRLPEAETPDTPRFLPDSEVGWLVGRYLADGSTSGDTATVNLNGPLTAALVRGYVHGTSAKTKGLRSRVWRRSDEFLGALLMGYLEGDGHYDEANGRWRLGFTRNDRLASDLRTLAARLGLPLRLAIGTTTGFGKAWPVYRGQIRLTTERLRQRQYGTVVAIRRSRGREFWDVEVEDEPHLFALASGVLTHNSKPNPMPESVTDRPTKSHEYVFLLTKSPRYWFDQEAVREKYQDSTIARDAYGYNHAFANQFRGSPTDARHPNGKELPPGSFAKGPDGRRKTSVQAGDGSIQHRDGERWPNGGRNVRSVWEIATQPYAEAHFATYPQELVRRCLLAGCPEWVCGTCGKPRERIVERGESDYARLKREQGHEWTDMDAAGLDRGVITRAGEGGQTRNSNGTVPSLRSADTETVGWSDCGHDNYQPGTVLDPFLGSGTTALVARNHSRRSIGIELNQEYCELAARRLAQQSLLAGEAA